MAEANSLAVDGGTLIFVDVPPGTEFGIDMNTWNVGEKFRGVRMIPVGLHYIYYSAVNKQGDTAPRTGFFHFFKKGEILVRKYDKFNEDIVEVEATAEEVERFQQNMKELTRYLGPYPYDSWRKWVSLTSYMTEPALERLVPLLERGKINSATELITIPSEPKSDIPQASHGKSTGEHALLPNMEAKPGTEIRFTKFPEKKWPDTSNPSEISHHNMDLSYTLDTMLSEMGSPDELLGELQMAFVCFLVGQVYSAFEQWKHLVNLFCSCEDAVRNRQDLYMKFVSVIYFQVGEVPPDFFVDIVTRNNFLTTTFQTFFSILSELEGSVSPQLTDRVHKFRAYLTKKFKWNFEWEPDEYAPVVVDEGACA